MEGCSLRPLMLVYLGRGVLSFMVGSSEAGVYRWYSHDYGRTWPEKVRLPVAPDGEEVEYCEGNSLVERDEDGTAVLIGETGGTASKGPFPDNPLCGCVRWSRDGGRKTDDS